MKYFLVKKKKKLENFSRKFKEDQSVYISEINCSYPVLGAERKTNGDKKERKKEKKQHKRPKTSSNLLTYAE